MDLRSILNTRTNPDGVGNDEMPTEWVLTGIQENDLPARSDCDVETASNGNVRSVRGVPYFHQPDGIQALNFQPNYPSLRHATPCAMQTQHRTPAYYYNGSHDPSYFLSPREDSEPAKRPLPSFATINYESATGIPLLYNKNSLHAHQPVFSNNLSLHTYPFSAALVRSPAQRFNRQQYDFSFLQDVPGSAYASRVQFREYLNCRLDHVSRSGCVKGPIPGSSSSLPLNSGIHNNVQSSAQIVVPSVQSDRRSLARGGQSRVSNCDRLPDLEPQNFGIPKSTDWKGYVSRGVPFSKRSSSRARTGHSRSPRRISTSVIHRELSRDNHSNDSMPSNQPHSAIEICSSDHELVTMAPVQAISKDPQLSVSSEHTTCIPKRGFNCRAENNFADEERTSSTAACEEKNKALVGSWHDAASVFPCVSTYFSGIAQDAVGDLLQLWDFIVSFAGLLRCPSTSFMCLERAFASSSRQPVLDVLLVRLVYAIVEDEDLTHELSVELETVQKLRQIRSSERLTSCSKVASSLPDILNSDIDDDKCRLAEILRLLSNSKDKNAFYKLLDAADRILIMRHLMEHACVANTFRECVQHSIEHDVEERKKARDEILAGRRKLEQELKQLREELADYRIRHKLFAGITESDSQGDKRCIAECRVERRDTSIVERQGHTSIAQSKVHKHPKVGSGSFQPTGRGISKEASRKEKLSMARSEREVERRRRDIQRGAELIEAKLDRVRAALRSLRNVRVRHVKDSAKSFDSKNELVGASGCPAGQSRPDVHTKESDVVRTYPLGVDRHDRAYWYFRGIGRVWIEDTKKRLWSYLDSKDAVRSLLKWFSSQYLCESELQLKLAESLPSIDYDIMKSLRSQSTHRCTDSDEQSSPDAHAVGSIVDNSIEKSEDQLCNAQASIEVQNDVIPRRSSRVRVSSYLQRAPFNNHEAEIHSCGIIAGTGTKSSLRSSELRPKKRSFSVLEKALDAAPIKQRRKHISQESIARSCERRITRATSKLTTK